MLYDESQTRPDSSLVVRHVKGRLYDAEANKIDGSAFDLNEKDKDTGLSFTERYIFQNEDEEDIEAIRLVTASYLKLKKNDRFAELSVGLALEKLRKFTGDFKFVADPLEGYEKYLANPAHVLLVGLPLVGTSVGDLESKAASDYLTNSVVKIHAAVVSA